MCRAGFLLHLMEALLSSKPIDPLKLHHSKEKGRRPCSDPAMAMVGDLDTASRKRKKEDFLEGRKPSIGYGYGYGYSYGYGCRGRRRKAQKSELECAITTEDGYLFRSILSHGIRSTTLLFFSLWAVGSISSANLPLHEPCRIDPAPVPSSSSSNYSLSGAILTLVMGFLVGLRVGYYRNRSGCSLCADAKKAEQTKQQVMDDVFNNIRVPFNAIVLGLGHLKSTAGGNGEVKEKGELVQMMIDCADSMTGVLDHAAHIGEWDNSAMELRLEEFDLLAFLKLLSDMLDGTWIEFALKVDPSAKEILTANRIIADKHKVLQTIGNFLSIAVNRYPTGGRLELSVRCEEVSDQERALKKAKGECLLLHPSECFCPRSDGSHLLGSTQVAKLVISVHDNGAGLSEEDQARLSTPPSPLHSNNGGAIASLSTAKRLAEQSGGHIGVKSKEGEESTLYMALPYPLATPLSIPKKEVAVEESKNGKDCSRRVLLVEDTKINRIVLRKVLQNLNLHCEEAENGLVAVNFLKQGRTYDLILMDKEMPVMDGHEATRQLRTMGVKTPIVALTGNALQSDKELFFAAGVDEFQTKPLSREKLVQLLVRFGVQS